MAARSINLSNRHNEILNRLKKKLDISLSAVVSRSLELMEEKEARRSREVSGNILDKWDTGGLPEERK